MDELKPGKKAARTKKLRKAANKAVATKRVQGTLSLAAQKAAATRKRNSEAKKREDNNG